MHLHSVAKAPRMRLAVLWLLLLQLQAGRVGLGKQLEARLDTVRRILHEVPLVDGHNDLSWNIRKFLKNQLVNFLFAIDLREMSPWSRGSWSYTDLLRLREGMVAAQVSTFPGRLSPATAYSGGVPTLHLPGWPIQTTKPIRTYIYLRKLWEATLSLPAPGNSDDK
jgi:hypothetical protein